MLSQLSLLEATKARNPWLNAVMQLKAYKAANSKHCHADQETYALIAPTNIKHR